MAGSSIQPDVSVVVPAYRSAYSLPELIPAVADILKGRSLEFEIIVVDDASDDGTWDSLLALQHTLPNRLRAYRLRHNLGQHAATLFGISRARGSVVVTMDDDFEHLPEELPKLLDKLASDEVDLVYARFLRRHHNRLRQFITWPALKLLLLLYGLRLRPTSYRAMTAQLAHRLCLDGVPEAIIDFALARLADRMTLVTIAHGHRRYGISNYTGRNLLRLGMRSLAARFGFGSPPWPAPVLLAEVDVAGQFDMVET